MADSATEGWAFITLCNWHVSNGQVTLGDPAYLQIDEATDATLFQAMQSFLPKMALPCTPTSLASGWRSRRCWLVYPQLLWTA